MQTRNHCEKESEGDVYNENQNDNDDSTDARWLYQGELKSDFWLWKETKISFTCRLYCLCLFALIFERINITAACHGNYKMNTGLDAVGPDPQPDGQDPRPGEDPGQQEGGAQEDRGPPADRDDQQVAREHMHK